MESFDKVVNNYTGWLDNPYVSGALYVFLIAYVGMVAPKPPQFVAKMFDNKFFQVFYLFMLVFVAKRNATVALIAAIAFLVSMMALNRIKIKLELMDGSLSENSMHDSLSENPMHAEGEAVKQVMKSVIAESVSNAESKLSEVSKARAEGIITLSEEESIKKSISQENSAEVPMAELVQEVIQRKQEEKPMTAEAVREICRNVWKEYKRQFKSDDSCAIGNYGVDLDNINNIGVSAYADDESFNAPV